MIERIRDLSEKEIAIKTAIIYLQNKLIEVQDEREQLISELAEGEQLHVISEILDEYLTNPVK